MLCTRLCSHIIGSGSVCGALEGSLGALNPDSSPQALSPQLQFSEVLVKWRRFFHQMAAEQGQGGRAALEMRLEVEKLQVSRVISEG